jgi:hypothetical protein
VVALRHQRRLREAPDSQCGCELGDSIVGCGDKVYYLSAFPGKASEIAGADATSFKAFDTTYAKDKSNAYFDGHPIPAADATTFAVLDRGGFAKDRNHVYQLDRPISDDPAHFELVDGGLSTDSTAVYWTDGGVLSDDPAHFAIVSNNDHYLFTKDSRTVHVNGKPIADADPATFHVLQGAYAQDARRIFYFHRPGHRCGCGVVPCARRTVCR